MKITIHRGNQIGGCITEIKTDQARICIDFGAELPSAERDSKVKDDFEIDGVTTGERNCDAVFITHYHGDHIGLYSKVHSDIPIYIGTTAKEIHLAFSQRMKLSSATKITDSDINRIETFKTFDALEKIKIADLVVTPILVDHSAFDSYMFLVESGGKRILHTGDFRTHGFGGDAVLPMLTNEVGVVDALIAEGTTLSRPGKKTISEADLHARAKEIIAENDYVFVLCASTNIDRMSAFYKATPRGKFFICDKYQKNILDIVTKHVGDKNPQYNFQKIHNYGNNLLERFRQLGFFMLIRSNASFMKIIDKFLDDKSRKVKFIYSMWEGYKNDKTLYPAIVEMTTKYNFESLHTSGHATAEAIKMVCDIVKPKKIIPIHGENVAENMQKLGMPYEVLTLQDGEEVEI